MFVMEDSDRQNDKYVKLHNKGVPLAFVLLWIVGLLSAIKNPDIVSCFLPNAELIGIKVKAILNGLICVYFVFVIEILVTLLDVKLDFKIKHKRFNRNKIKEANKVLWKMFWQAVAPTLILSFLVLFLYGICQREILLLFFIVLTSYNKYYEVRLPNKGEKVLSDAIPNSLFPK